MTNSVTRLAWCCAVVIVVVTNSGLASAAPAQWGISDGGNEHWYEAINISGGVTWEEANSHATSLGGYLVTLTSPHEDNWVYDNLDSYNLWIGAYQDISAPDYSEPAGGWRWTTGENWDYTNWSNGLDNNDILSEPEEEFAHYCCDGSWNDIYDVNRNSGISTRKNFLVEWDSYPVPEPSSIVLVLAGLLAAAGVGYQRR